MHIFQQNGAGNDAGNDVDEAAGERDLQVADAAEVALQTVGHGWKGIEPGHGTYVGYAEFNDLWVIGEQAYKGPGRKPGQYTDRDSVDDLNQKREAERLYDPVVFLCADVLGEDACGAVGHVLFRDDGIVIEAVGRIEGGGGSDAEAVDHGLGRNFSDLNRGLLEGGNDAEGEDALELLGVDDEPLSAKSQDRYLLLGIDPAEKGTDSFAENGAQGGSENAHIKNCDKEEVADDVEACADRQKIERGAAVTHRP